MKFLKTRYKILVITKCEECPCAEIQGGDKKHISCRLADKLEDVYDLTVDRFLSHDNFIETKDVPSWCPLSPSSELFEENKIIKALKEKIKEKDEEIIDLKIKLMKKGGG